MYKDHIHMVYVEGQIFWTMCQNIDKWRKNKKNKKKNTYITGE